MESENDYKEERFDSFLNKTIILPARTYFKKQINIIDKERLMINDMDYSAILDDFVTLNSSFLSTDDVDVSLQLKSALKSLSAIEQAVIFLLYDEELSQKEAAEILEVYSKTVSKIKIRAINKLKKYFKEGSENEK